MTLPDDLVKAAADAPCQFTPGTGVCGSGPLGPPFETLKHPECAVAAVLRALRESEAVGEELADVEHERWSKWMRWLYQHGKWNDDGSFTIHPDRAERWRFLSQIPYADLDSETQEHDRVEARTSLAAIAKLADDG